MIGYPDTMIEPHPVCLEASLSGVVPEIQNDRAIRNRAIVEAYARGDTVTDIAKAYRLCDFTVRQIANRAGVYRGHRQLSIRKTEQIATVLEAIYEGRTLQAIADGLGITRERVRQLAAREGVTTQDRLVERPTRFAKAVERSQLAEERRFEVKRRQKAKRRELVMALKQLAQELGRTPTTKELSIRIGKNLPAVYAHFAQRSTNAGTHYGKRGLARLYRAAGLRVRAVGGRGHRSITTSGVREP